MHERGGIQLLYAYDIFSKYCLKDFTMLRVSIDFGQTQWCSRTGSGFAPRFIHALSVRIRSCLSPLIGTHLAPSELLVLEHCHDTNRRILPWWSPSRLRTDANFRGRARATPRCHPPPNQPHRDVWIPLRTWSMVSDWISEDHGCHKTFSGGAIALQRASDALICQTRVYPTTHRKIPTKTTSFLTTSKRKRRISSKSSNTTLY
jgi:hypothetical protein